MMRITVEQDAHGQHAVIVEGRVFARHHSLQSMPRAEYRITAAGKRRLLAAERGAA